MRSPVFLQRPVFFVATATGRARFGCSPAYVRRFGWCERLLCAFRDNRVVCARACVDRRR